jgi:hypothetical protein
MKSLKDFITEQQPVNQEEVVSMEVLQLQDQPLFEGSAKSHPADPPAVLVMKRKYIRQFPNNQRVAMYYVDKLDKYITVPYETSHWDNKGYIPTSEGVDDILGFDILGFLENIVEDYSSKVLTFANGDYTKVEPLVAESILKVYSALNEDNKQKILEMAIRSKEHFSKVIDFTNKHLG